MRSRSGQAAILLLAAVLLLPAVAQAQLTQSLTIGGRTYTKWLWGDQRNDGSLYNFTTVPGEGYGDNGQGTELEMLLAAKPGRTIEVSGRIHSRFSQNQWTNFGGFGGTNPATTDPPPGSCVGGDCGEFDPRSNQYIKLRGMTVRFTPGWTAMDVATVGATDLGMFDPFTVGKIRYIDRDNPSAVHLSGDFGSKVFAYDLMRLSLPRLWAGPNFNTGDYTAADGAYVLQMRFNPSPLFDGSVIGVRVRDQEVDARDRDFDDGRDVDFRFRNDVYGVRFGIHPSAMLDIRGQAYFTDAESNPDFGTPTGFGLSGFSPAIAGEADDEAFKANVDLNDPFGVGLSFNVEYFDIGAQYSSILAARRESDVLLTEGHDATWIFPGPDNSAFGVFPGNPTRIGYGGFQGNAQQVATVNVDNEFADFDEPMAESVIGWKGFTIVPSFSIGELELAGEYSKVDYNTNWQAWGDPSRGIENAIYPNFESDAGLASFRNAYAPFQEKETDILVLRFAYLLDVAKGVDLFGKVKWIDETDKRLDDPRFLPYRPGDCPGGGVACTGNVNEYSPGNSTAAIYGNPPVITVNGVTGYQWKPFDSLSDDDRNLDYTLYQLGAGYQLSDNLYSSLTYEIYDAELQDGNTAFQAYRLHSLASGQHDKNKLIVASRYTYGAAELGLSYEYNWGEFDPDFGGGFVPQVADEAINRDFGSPIGSLGFRGRFGGWNSLETREFRQQRLKAFMKVTF
jgi:hypothetical protein